jgi:hypothetical protein
VCVCVCVCVGGCVCVCVCVCIDQDEWGKMERIKREESCRGNRITCMDISASPLCE